MIRTTLAALAAILYGFAAAAGTYTLTPASPQPDEAALKQGLKVSYHFPGDVKSLHQAEGYLDYGVTPGEPLVGFDYPDTNEGEPVLTSDKGFYVVAKIEGFLKMDPAGVYQIDFISNDGLKVILGGQQITYFDGRHPCENAGVATVTAPVAGWYKLEAVYFQRLGTSCLLAEWTPPGGGLDWIPNEATAYLP